MNLSAFEHQFIRTYKESFGESKTLGSTKVQRSFLLAVSGGADSIAVFHLMMQFKNMFGYDLRVAHVHHGYGGIDAQNQFRDRSLSLVKKLCEQHQIPLLSNENKIQSSSHLKSEADYKKYRYTWFNAWRAENEILVLGHHAEDLLETQLMDLLRGSHFEHWKKFKAFYEGVFRPLFYANKKSIIQHLKEKKLKYEQDPSNAQTQMTRNWLRAELLPALEEKFPGAVSSLSQNLWRLYKYEAKISDASLQQAVSKHEVSLSKWLLFSYSQKEKFVLECHLGLSKTSLTLGQIKEVIRHLDQRHKSIKFQTGPIFWIKNAEKIKAHRENI